MAVIEPEPEPAPAPAPVTEPPRKESLTDSKPPGSAEDEGSESGDEQLLERAMNQATHAKAHGNKLFSAWEYEEALSQYQQALEIASEVPSSDEIRSMCHANRAICFTKLLGKYEETIKQCTKALELNPSYLKALLRRAEAHEKLEHYDEAISGKCQLHFYSYSSFLLLLLNLSA